MRKSFIKKLIKQAIQEQELGMDSTWISNGNVPRSVRYIDPLTKFSVADANNFSEMEMGFDMDNIVEELGVSRKNILYKVTLWKK